MVRPNPLLDPHTGITADAAGLCRAILATDGPRSPYQQERETKALARILLHLLERDAGETTHRRTTPRPAPSRPREAADGDAVVEEDARLVEEVVPPGGPAQVQDEQVASGGEAALPQARARSAVSLAQVLLEITEADGGWLRLDELTDLALRAKRTSARVNSSTVSIALRSLVMRDLVERRQDPEAGLRSQWKFANRQPADGR